MFKNLQFNSNFQNHALTQLSIYTQQTHTQSTLNQHTSNQHTFKTTSVSRFCNGGMIMGPSNGDTDRWCKSGNASASSCLDMFVLGSCSTNKRSVVARQLNVSLWMDKWTTVPQNKGAGCGSVNVYACVRQIKFGTTASINSIWLGNVWLFHERVNSVKRIMGLWGYAIELWRWVVECVFIFVVDVFKIWFFVELYGNFFTSLKIVIIQVYVLYNLCYSHKHSRRETHVKSVNVNSAK